MTDEPQDLPATSLLHGDARARRGAIVPAIVQATTFATASNEEFLDLATRSFADEFYVRYGNPNHTQVAEVVASLEGAERAIVTASGMGAVSTLALALLKAGDHVVVQRSAYPGTTVLTTELLERFGVSAALVADLVWHSATKYLAGHSDVAAGVVAGSEELIERVWRTNLTLGSVLGPFDAWLLLRGLRTLDVRMTRHNENGLAVAHFLEDHPEVVSVYYPGLVSHPQHDLAAQQMSGFSGLLSFVVRGGPARADQVLDALRLTTRAASLGSVHSLATRPAAMWSGRRPTADEDVVDEALIRLSVGIEAKEDLIADLGHALALTSS